MLCQTKRGVRKEVIKKKKKKMRLQLGIEPRTFPFGSFSHQGSPKKVQKKLVRGRGRYLPEIKVSPNLYQSPILAAPTCPHGSDLNLYQTWGTLRVKRAEGGTL